MQLCNSQNVLGVESRRNGRRQTCKEDIGAGTEV